MQSDDHLMLLKNSYEFKLALVSHGNLGADNFKKVQGDARENFEDLQYSVRPWLGLRTKEERSQGEVDEFKAAWEYYYGFSPDDEEAMADWEDSLSEVSNESQDKFKEQQLELVEAQNRFIRARDAVKNKRFRQQGRN